MTARHRTRQLPALTSLRFVAALQVVAFHYANAFFTTPPPGFVRVGFSGVTFFFLLSGFILAYTYEHEDFSAAPARRHFLVARVARIYPILLLSLAAALPGFIAGFLHHADTLRLPALAFAAVLLAPLSLQAWVPGASCALNCSTWSISTEFFFYALFPLLAPLVARRPGRWLVLALLYWALTCAACMALWARFGGGESLILGASGSDGSYLLKQAIKYFPPARLAEFVLGMALFALWRRHHARLRIGPLLAASGLAAALILAGLERISETLLSNGLTALAWAPLILAAAQMRGGVLARPAMVFLGQISFALYAFHVPLISYAGALDRHVLGGHAAEHPWAAALGTFAVALAVSALAWRVVEVPGRRWLLARFQPRPAFARAPLGTATD